MSRTKRASNSSFFRPFFLILLFGPLAEPILSSRPRGSHGRRAQGRSRMAVAKSSIRKCVSRPLLDRPSTAAGSERVGIQSVRIREQQARQDDLRRACLGVARRSRAPRPCIRQIPRGDLNHDAVMRIGGEAPRRQAHSFFRHRSHGDTTGHCHLGSSSHSSRQKARSTPDLC